MKKTYVLFVALCIALVGSLSSCNPYHCNGSWRGGSVTGRNTFGPKRTSQEVPAPVKTPTAKEVRL